MTKPAVMSYGELHGYADPWPAFLDRQLLIDSQFQAGMYLDDCAKAGNWSKVLEILSPENSLVNINQCRPATNARSTVLHRAAETGAPAEVIEALLQRGAFRSLRDENGSTAFDLATRNPEFLDASAELLRPTPSPLDEDRITALDTTLAAVLDGWLQSMFAGRDLRTILRYPPVGALHEAPKQQLWVQLPHFFGFRVVLRRGYLELLIGERGTPGVTAQGFVITHRGPVMVYESRADAPPREPGSE